MKVERAVQPTPWTLTFLKSERPGALTLLGIGEHNRGELRIWFRLGIRGEVIGGLCKFNRDLKAGQSRYHLLFSVFQSFLSPWMKAVPFILKHRLKHRPQH